MSGAALDFRPSYLSRIATILPKPSLITEPAKTADMIRISCPGICGEEDFRYLWEEKARTPRVNERDSAGQQAIIEG